MSPISPEGLVVEARDIEADAQLQRRASGLIGGLVTNNEFEVEQVDVVGDVQSNVPRNLSEALEAARDGDEVALEMVRSNVTTDYFERAYKSGFVSEVTLSRRPNGDIEQYGQSIEDVHMNSLRFLGNEKLIDRAKVETLNSVRDRHYVNSGLLKDNARVTFSLVHDQMDDEEASEVGFFVHTRSISIQVMTEREDGEIIVQSAFVAGRENLSSEIFDRSAVIRLAEKLGVDYSDCGSEDILGRPLVVNKSMIPNLSLSIVEMFDVAATEVTGRDKFFGRDTDSDHDKDYLEKMKESQKLTSSMKENIDSVVSELVNFRADTPLQATEKLAELNDKLLKERIVVDESIDARVLGVETAYHVNHARAILSSNVLAREQQHRQLQILQRKINLGNSSSCPGGAGGNKTDELSDIFDLASTLVDNQDESDSESLEDCEFVSKECPKCGEKNVKTECKDGVYYGACGCASE